MKKRLVGVGIVISIIFFALCIRLFVVQIANGQEYKDEAQKRQRVSLTGLAMRGVIYDRNMQPLTNREKTFIHFVPKNEFGYELKNILSDLDAERISSSNIRYDVYRSERYDEQKFGTLADDFSVFTFTMNKRYTEDQPAEHMIGYINAYDNKGQTGIENSFDSVLAITDNSYYVIMDGLRKILPGFGMNLNSDIKKSSVITTLDYDIQRKAEKVMREEDCTGSVVILDSNTGDLLAAVSTPSYDPNRIEDYIDSNEGELLNKSVRGEYAPGSVFKIVVLAAALESGKYTEESTFFCDGYDEINGVRIACASEDAGGHGQITLKRAFEVSCNSAFIQIGQQLGGSTILSYAQKFGLGKKALSEIHEEKTGNLPKVYDTAGAGIGNLSIGQGELLATPVQIARMTNVIASGGLDMGMRLVKSEMSGGKISEEYFSPEPVRVISPQNAETIRHLMQSVVKDGTGNNIKLHEGLDAAGKTSSAQSADSGRMVVHGWFSGFIPAKDPQYTITVFVKNGKSGRQSAAPIFEKIAREIME